MTPREPFRPHDSSDTDEPQDFIEGNNPEDALADTDPDDSILDHQNPDAGIKQADEPNEHSPYAER